MHDTNAPANVGNARSSSQAHLIAARGCWIPVAIGHHDDSKLGLVHFAVPLLLPVLRRDHQPTIGRDAVAVQELQDGPHVLVALPTVTRGAICARWGQYVD